MAHPLVWWSGFGVWVSVRAMLLMRRCAEALDTRGGAIAHGNQI
jgi:hypothetical protein